MTDKLSPKQTKHQQGGCERHADLDVNSLCSGWYTLECVMSTATSTTHHTSTPRMKYHSRFTVCLNNVHCRLFRLTDVSFHQHACYLV